MAKLGHALMSSKTFIDDVSNFFASKTKDVPKSLGLVTNCNNNGSGMSKHDKYAKGYAIKCCAACFDNPLCPVDG